MIVVAEPNVPADGEPSEPAALVLVLALVLLAVPALHPVEELVELGVLALLEADPGALLLLLDPVAVPETTLVDEAEAAVATEGTPVVEESGRHVSTCTGSLGDTLSEHRTWYNLESRNRKCKCWVGDVCGKAHVLFLYGLNEDKLGWLATHNQGLKYTLLTGVISFGRK